MPEFGVVCLSKTILHFIPSQNANTLSYLDLFPQFLQPTASSQNAYIYQFPPLLQFTYNPSNPHLLQRPPYLSEPVFFFIYQFWSTTIASSYLFLVSSQFSSFSKYFILAPFAFCSLSFSFSTLSSINRLHYVLFRY